MKTSILELFPFLIGLPENEQKQLVHIEVKGGQTILSAGDSCNQAAFVYSGEIKIMKTNKNGREVNLYHVFPGQVCILTVTSVLSHQLFPANAVAAKDTKLFFIEKQWLKRWLSSNFALQELIYQTTADRFITMMGLFDDLIFRRIDERVVEFLLENLPADETILCITHEEMAAELGTSREVVSRVMKNLEKSNCIRLFRGKIMMHSREQLKSILTKE